MIRQFSLPLVQTACCNLQQGTAQQPVSHPTAPDVRMDKLNNIPTYYVPQNISAVNRADFIGYLIQQKNQIKVSIISLEEDKPHIDMYHINYNIFLNNRT